MGTLIPGVCIPSVVDESMENELRLTTATMTVLAGLLEPTYARLNLMRPGSPISRKLATKNVKQSSKAVLASMRTVTVGDARLYFYTGE